eukprot:TRINITY_DN9376_c0_g2_i1.p1 TRINITY_DN9376_c0_g2~~TRINITY_DN9376_c0_g2_i1.p1  ORF type:complete len:459 (+),score=173.69 TRINITY_DN9376_c0_g2_i1:107-1483(+)
MSEIITADAEVSKTILKEGSGSTPLKGQEVTINYRLVNAADEKVLDSSFARNSPFKFTIGSHEAIPVLEQVVGGMKIAEKAQFKVRDRQSKEFVLEVELVDFVNKKKPMYNMVFEEKKLAVEELKAKGNENFKKQMFAEAAQNYREGLTYLDTVVEARYQSAISDIWKSLQLNLCICLNALSSWKESKGCADKVLQRDLDNPKAHYLRGIAEKHLLLFDEALQDFNKALLKNPSDERIKYEIEAVKEQLKKLSTKEKEAMKKLFKAETLYSEKEEVVVKLPEYDPSNPQVYMDIKIGKRNPIKIVIELFKKYVPKTVENFRCLCTGELSTGGNKLYYGASSFYKLAKGRMLEGGDIEKNNGTGGKSIYVGKFTAELTHLEHSAAGLLSTVANEPKGTDSKFFILLSPAQGLDVDHTVFGRIIKGLELLKELESVEVDEKDAPKESISIENCGMYEEKA